MELAVVRAPLLKLGLCVFPPCATLTRRSLAVIACLRLYVGGNELQNGCGHSYS